MTNGLSTPISPPPCSSLDDLFAEGFCLHENGQLAEAEEKYRLVLNHDAMHFGALHLSGVLLTQLKRHPEGLVLIERALELNPDNLQANYNRGIVLNEMGQYQAAFEAFGKAILINPEYAEAHCSYGNLQKIFGDRQGALASYDRALAIKADYATALNNRGMILRDLGSLDAALDSYDRAISAKPDYSNAYNNRGLLLKELGQFEAALQSYDAALALKPDFPGAHSNRGLLLKDLGQLEAALASFDRAIDFDPGSAEAFYNRGLVCEALGRADDALNCFDQAIALNPGYASAYRIRGNLLAEMGRFDDALVCHERAINISPDNADCHYDMGILLNQMGDTDSALNSYARALQSDPAYAKANNNRGRIFMELAQLDSALLEFDQAIMHRPDYAFSHLNRAMAHLQLGNFKLGWLDYEWRWAAYQNKPSAQDSGKPLWLGIEPIEGKTILLQAEQGLGDTLQFCRYAVQLQQLGARVVLQAQVALLPLLSKLEGIDALVGTGSDLPAFDYYCPLLSLPLAFSTCLETIPARPRYLQAPAGQIEQWAAKLGPRTKPRVGIVWSGNATHPNNHNRSIKLSLLLDQLPDCCDYFSLQKELQEDDRVVLAGCSTIRHFGEELVDFSSTAGLCELMDVVFSVDTSVAHLAGALGKKTFILLPFSAEWRWLQDRSDSPWYPTATLLRQGRPGDWTDVIADLALALRSLATSLDQ